MLVVHHLCGGQYRWSNGSAVMLFSLRPEEARQRCFSAIQDPGKGGLNSLRVRPGQRYRLPETVLDAEVTALEHDLLFRCLPGGQILLRDLFTVEVMTNPPIIEIGDRDVSAAVLAALGLEDASGTRLRSFLKIGSCTLALPHKDCSLTLAALREEGILSLVNNDWCLY